MAVRTAKVHPTLGGCTLEAILGYPGAIGAQFRILPNDGVDAPVARSPGSPRAPRSPSAARRSKSTLKVGGGNDVVLRQLTESTQESTPVLSIIRQPPQTALLSWTSNAPGFELLSSPRLQPAGWTPLPEPVMVIAEEKTVTVTATNAHTMFRLFKP